MFFLPLQPIAPYFTLVQPAPIDALLTIGSAIKDQQPGEETEMTRALIKTNVKTQEKFDSDMLQYNEDYYKATLQAERAILIIDTSRNKKAMTITALAATIIMATGIGMAAISLSSWPIAFMATPFLIGIVPTGYYTSVFCEQVSQLEREIQSPKTLEKSKPRLRLPVYQPEKDLDLKQTRVDVKNKFATMTLVGIAQSGCVHIC